MLRPRRSALYMPGANPRALEKARELPADCLILDLEDAVAPDAKPTARTHIAEALQAGGYGQRELVVRINHQASPWGADDLARFARAELHAIALPKVESAAEIQQVATAMSSLGYADDVALWAMIETPRGVLNAASIATAHPRLKVLVMGTSDLAKDLRVPHTPDRLGFITSLSLCVLAARAAGLEVLDGVHLDLEDESGLVAACQQGRQLGFDGKTLIHPKQIAAANEAFAPSAIEIERSHAIIAAWQEAESKGQGVVVLNGRLVENLHVEEARRTLALAAAINGR